MQVEIETYAATSILDHCYRVQALQANVENRSSICGMLLGFRLPLEKKIVIADFVPGHNEENIKHVKNFTNAAILPLGWYSLTGLNANEITRMFKRNTSTLLLTVQLPSSENKYTQQISALDFGWGQDVNTAPVTTQMEVTMRHESPITNIIMASVMSDMFPDVADEIANHHRLSVETHAIADSDDTLPVKNVPSEISIEAITKSLAEIEQLPSAKNTPKKLAEEIKELQEKIRQTLKDVQELNDEDAVAGASPTVGAAFGEDRLKETMLVKCLAAKVNQRLAARRKQFTYEVNKKDNGQGFSFRGGYRRNDQRRNYADAN